MHVCGSLLSASLLLQCFALIGDCILLLGACLLVLAYIFGAWCGGVACCFLCFLVIAQFLLPFHWIPSRISDACSSVMLVEFGRTNTFALLFASSPCVLLC